MVNLWLIMVNNWNNNGILVGGDWNHGILNDFPETVGNGKSSAFHKQLGMENHH